MRGNTLQLLQSCRRSGCLLLFWPINEKERDRYKWHGGGRGEGRGEYVNINEKKKAQSISRHDRRATKKNIGEEVRG
jgi:hypothetical protein